MSIIYTLLMFSVIIFFHELGHFVVARLCGVRVIEFSLGMGPAIFKYQGKETLYALRILPIGGYAAMEGENGEFGEYKDDKSTDTKSIEDNTSDTNSNDDNSLNEEIESKNSSEDLSEDKDLDENLDKNLDKNLDDNSVKETVDKKNSRSFSDKSVLQRILICVAGPVMNFVIAFVTIVITLIGVETYSTTTISGFKEDSNTNLTGLRENDTITKINGVSILTDTDIIYEVLRDYDSDGIFDMEVIRDGNKLNLSGVTFNLVYPEPDEYGEVDPDATPAVVFDFYVTTEEASTSKMLKRGIDKTYSLSRSSIFSVGDLIAGRVPLSQLSGPIGVGQVVGEAAKMSLSVVLNLAAMISISIGVLNLLPFPALDGGRIVFYMIEGIRGKPIDPKIEGYINGTGMMLLLLLMLVVTFKDITALF